MNLDKYTQQPEWTGHREIFSSNEIITKCDVRVVTFRPSALSTRVDYYRASHKSVQGFFIYSVVTPLPDTTSQVIEKKLW